MEFKSDALKPLTGKSLAEVAKMRGEIGARHNHGPRPRRSLARGHGLLHDVGGQHPEADPAAMGVVRSDAASMAPELPFTKSSAHPRAYGNSPGCSGDTYAMRKSSRSRRPYAGYRAFPRPTSPSIDEASSVKACSPMSSSSIPRRSQTGDIREATPVCCGDGPRIRQRRAVLKDGEHTGAKPGRALSGAGRK